MLNNQFYGWKAYVFFCDAERIQESVEQLSTLELSDPTVAAPFIDLLGYARWGWYSYLDTIPTYMTIAVPENAPNTTNVSSSGATVVWEPLGSEEAVEAYSLRLNRVEVYRGVDTSVVISNLEPNMTYFVGVAGVASWGTDGRVGPLSNFTTLEI
ncbi:hypothetical protein PR003_g3391 [Phytophthora rubi]|uniref:Fibronectin type-III domain-containing protein n=1 Tax=Phytophthora rubi TaxID=129364 RepID=A0A6A4FVL6_9STRA|nr:hypothetical protein PR003_g3391 [Phytophthora rubi]